MQRTLRRRVTTAVAALAVVIGLGAMAYAAGMTPAVPSYAFNFQVGPGGAVACATYSHPTAQAPAADLTYSSSTPSGLLGNFAIAAPSCVQLSSYVYNLGAPGYYYWSNAGDSGYSSVKVRAETPSSDPYHTTYKGSFQP